MSDHYDKLLNSKIHSAPEKTEAPQEPKKPKRSVGGRLLAALLILVLVAALLVCGAGVWGYTLTVNGRNLPNVYVDGIFVGNMTPEETENALRDAKWDALEGESLTVRLPAGAEFKVDYLRSGAVLSRYDAVTAACNYGHDKGVFSNLWAWLTNHIRPVDVGEGERVLDDAYIRSCMDEGIAAMNTKLRVVPYTVDEENERLLLYKGAGGVELDTEGLKRAVDTALRSGEKELSFDTLLREPEMPNFEEIYWEVAAEPQNAGYSETFEVIPETVGVSFGVEQAVQLWQSAGIGEQVIVPLTITQPDFTAEQLNALLFRDLLGAQMTYYTGSTAERINNIRLAAAKLDGLILLPGESFSYNEAVGKRTEEAGFQYADAYSDGQVVPELGGGICQVSSTLYSAALYSRLKILSRTNHYFKVGYLDFGMDATVSWGNPDFKFLNDKELPIKIAAYLNEDEASLVIEIWGTDFDGYRVQLHHTDEPIYDEEYTDTQIGWNVKTYRDLYDADGNFIDSGYVSTSIYYFHDEDIEWPRGVEKKLSDAFNKDSESKDAYL